MRGSRCPVFPLAAISLAIAAYHCQPGEPPRPSGVATVAAAAADEPTTPDDGQTWEETSAAVADHASAATQPMSLAPQ
jgi:hypothetical protein